jgi:hypothetical protein
MATEPITLFAQKIDPVHAFRVLREVAPKLEADGDENSWRHAVVTIGIWPLRKRSKISHDPAYYSEPNWSAQMDGMRGYFLKFPDVPQRARFLQLTRQFGFSLGTIVDPDLSANDYRLTIVQILASELEAVWFTPSSIRDASGRILLGANAGELDPKANWPSYAV